MVYILIPINFVYCHQYSYFVGHLVVVDGHFVAVDYFEWFSSVTFDKLILTFANDNHQSHVFPVYCINNLYIYAKNIYHCVRLTSYTLNAKSIISSS